ncbi:hypothetical protein Tco_0919739 [Tanacetum coccineum]
MDKRWSFECECNCELMGDDGKVGGCEMGNGGCETTYGDVVVSSLMGFHLFWLPLDGLDVGLLGDVIDEDDCDDDD